jgi:hypothetical protein
MYSYIYTIYTHSGIEYEQLLRDFYRREQRAPAKQGTSEKRRFNRSLNADALKVRVYEHVYVHV